MKRIILSILALPLCILIGGLLASVAAKAEECDMTQDNDRP